MQLTAQANFIVKGKMKLIVSPTKGQKYRVVLYDDGLGLIMRGYSVAHDKALDIAARIKKGLGEAEIIDQSQEEK